MTREEQKQRELFWIERLKEKSGIDFEILGSNENDFPDYEISADGVRIGLEVIDVMLSTTPGKSGGSSRQAKLALQNKLVAAAEAAHRDGGHDPVSAAVLFQPSRSIKLSGKDVDQIANRLANFVGTHIPASTSSDRHNLFEHPDSKVAPPLSTVFLRQPYEDEQPKWKLVEAHTVGQASTEALLPFIQAKNKRLGKLGKRDGPCWLLLVANRLAAASAYEPADPASLALSASAFDRTFFLLHPLEFYDSDQLG